MNFIPLVLLSTVLAATPVKFNDSIRDVYVDGKLTRTAQTLSSSSPRLIAVVCGDEVLLLDPEKQSVTKAAKSDFTFAPDRTSATTAVASVEPAGTLIRPNPSTYVAMLGGRNIVVSSHQSKAGTMTIDELWETAPVWRAVADHYQPDGAIVDRLRAIDEPVHLEVVLATWCGDSRQHVPRLLKSLALANNPNISVELIGIDAEFLAPAAVTAGQNITNVPTVIVRNGDREVGRFVETPAGATVEDDLCDIVAGTPKAHRGRLERGKLLASGTYVLRDAKKRREGTEVFELYEKPGGGVLVHSVIARTNGTSVETFASEKYVEVTHRAGTTTRTRIRRDGEAWALLSRGATGIVEQTITAPAAFIAPATLTYAWARDAATAYVVPERGVGAVMPLSVRVGRGTVPEVVRFADGSSRTLVR